jgi:hypothetical protein
MRRAPAVIAAIAAIAGCRDSHGSDWRRISQGGAGLSESKLPGLIPDNQLKTFLPDRVGDRLGQLPQGTMTRMGDRALSEATRNYRGAGSVNEGGQVELKIADARLEPRATQAIRLLANENEEAVMAERLVLPGAIGYARYDEGERVAQAQVLIGGRFIASATVVQAADAQDAAQALRAVDTQALARLAQVDH